MNHVSEIKREFVKFTAPGQNFTGLFERKRNEQGKFGWETIFDFTGEETGPFSVRATTDLKRKFEDVQEGETVRVEYKGDKPLQNGNTVKMFEVTKQGNAKPAAGSTWNDGVEACAKFLEALPFDEYMGVADQIRKLKRGGA